jgi:hypothetical protein
MLKVFETVAQDGLIRLPLDVPPTAHCVVTVLDDDLATLREQSQLELPDAKQRRMSELLLKNRDSALTTDECQELDTLAMEFDTAILIKGRALAALAHLNGDRQSD